MVKLIKVEKREEDGKGIVVLFADAKEDVIDDMFILGLSYGLTPSQGSVLYTASGDIANLTSDGTWEWVGEEDEDSRSVSTSVLTKSAPIEEPTVEEKAIEDTEEVGDEK